MNTSRTVVFAVVGGLVAGLLLCCGAAACWFGPSLLEASDDGSDPPVPAPERPIIWATGDLHSRLAAPGRPRDYDMEFADRSTGYVLFRGCTMPCPVTLYGTTDGGRTWQHLPLDGHGADVRSVTVVDRTRLAISLGQSTYRVSRDGGRTFTLEAGYPPDFEPAGPPRAAMVCMAYNAGRCSRHGVGRGDRAVAVQPPLPAGADGPDGVTSDATGRIWAVTAVKNLVHTFVSSDGGASWRPLPVLDVGSPPGRVELAAAADDTEPWLAIGHSGPARLSAYRGGADRWRAAVENRPVDIGWTRAVSVGGGPGAGAVALYDDRVGVLFDDGSWHAAAPTDVLAMSRLSDTTLVAAPHSLQGMWLGTRAGNDFGWTYVTVEPV